MLTNEKMWQIAMMQSAEDLGCRAEDFLSKKNILVPFKLGKKARKYLKLPITCNFRISRQYYIKNFSTCQAKIEILLFSNNDIVTASGEVDGDETKYPVPDGWV